MKKQKQRQQRRPATVTIHMVSYGHIVYDRETGDYAVFHRGNYAGSFSSSSAAVRELERLEYEALRRS